MHKKDSFSAVFIIISLLLAVLPFLVAFNEILTRFVQNFQLYTLVQNHIVPMESKMVGVFVRLFGIDYRSSGSLINANGKVAYLTWNCLGWQSLLLLAVTLIAGLRERSFTTVSKIETILIGLLGTFFINLIRITFIVLLLVWSQPVYSVVYHDYLAAAVTILWLIFFWWFSYTYVLEEKSPIQQIDNITAK